MFKFLIPKVNQIPGSKVRRKDPEICHSYKDFILTLMEVYRKQTLKKLTLPVIYCCITIYPKWHKQIP